MSRLSLLALAFSLTGCSLTGGKFASYYGDAWSPPSVGALSVTSEPGNLGGGELVITGTGFGDASSVSVMFADQNADIVSATDSEITVIVPSGPISGGAVDVVVATPTGFVVAEGAYTYELPAMYQDQTAFIQVNNFWESCYGGGASTLDDAYAEYGGVPCGEDPYIGYTGLEGTAEGYGFAYPRLHTPYINFFSATAQMEAGSDWTPQRPGPQPYGAFLEDLREDLGETVRLTNDAADSEKWCVNLDESATYYWGGGVQGGMDPVSVQDRAITEGAFHDSCNEANGQVTYSLDTLEFCSMNNEAGSAERVFRADWLPDSDFFVENTRGNIKVGVEVSGLAIDQEVQLPEPITFSVEDGIEPLELADGVYAYDLWMFSGFESCFADEGPGALDSRAIDLRWVPSEADLTAGGQVKAARTYVRVTVTQASLGWFGLSAFPYRSTVTVEDRNDVQSGMSHLEIPASVFFQLPSSNAPSGAFGPSSPLEDWAYVIVTMERVTDYSLQGSDGNVAVFSYSTGDLGFFTWTNPVDRGECENCLDDDGDGWRDADDPDCAAGGTAEQGEGTAACNDGLDNDGDGDADAEDANCENGSDEDEGDCDDGADGDRDGWADAADPDCANGGTSELGYGTAECNDDTDNDGDGDSDADDLDCTSAEGSEASAATGCTDTTDEDGDGWIDSADPDCATGASEVGVGTGTCNDGIDNDLDGSIDAVDLECADANDTDEGA